MMKETGLANQTALANLGGTQKEIMQRLQGMKVELALVQSFFKEVMTPDIDYGVIPGTDKPTLLKPGAEKLCELYGYAITLASLDEEKDNATGFYRVRATVRLVSKATGLIIAEGVGEANTMEARYRWRWLADYKLPKDFSTAGLEFQTRTSKRGSSFKVYKVENDDPFTLWNTVLKMAKKRALIDATLSATRLSGMFGQDMEDIQAWQEKGVPIDAEFTVRDSEGEAAPPPEAPKVEPPATPTVAKGTATNTVRKDKAAASKRNYSEFWTVCNKAFGGEFGTRAKLKEMYDTESAQDLTDEQFEAVIAAAQAVVNGGKLV